MNDLIKTQYESEETNNNNNNLLLAPSCSLYFAQHPFNVLYNTAPCFLGCEKIGIRLEEKEESLVTFRQKMNVDEIDVKSQ